jgi:hypothetical protein
MKFQELLDQYPRIAIVGPPRVGKTTLTLTIRDRPVIHTDDFVDWPWRDVPGMVIAEAASATVFVVEGVRAADALRNGLEVDAVLVLSDPKVDQTPAQEAMGRGVATVLKEWLSQKPKATMIDESELEWPTMDRAEFARPVQRFAFANFTTDRNEFEPTPQGGLRIKAVRLSKVGVFTYDRGGRKVREYRPAEELFRQETIDSLKGATVVIDHPVSEGGEVTPQNFRRLNVGHVENPRREGDALIGDIVVNDAGAVKAVLAGKLKEVSGGYANGRDPTPGITADTREPYDVVQRGYVFNHVAMGPPGWGRQGPDIGFTLDAQDNQVAVPPDRATKEKPMAKTADAFPTQQTPPVPGQAAAPPTQDAPPGGPPVPGVPAPAPAPADGPQEPLPVLSAADIKVLKDLVTAGPQLMKLIAAAAVAPPVPGAPAAPPIPPTIDQQAPAPGVPTPSPVVTTEEQKTMDSATQALVQETVAMQKDAERYLGPDYKLAGKTNQQIRLDVIKSADSTNAAGLTDKSSTESVTAAYGMAKGILEARITHEQKRAEHLGTFRAGTIVTGDAAEPASIEDKSQQAWKRKAG